MSLRWVESYKHACRYLWPWPSLLVPGVKEALHDDRHDVHIDRHLEHLGIKLCCFWRRVPTSMPREVSMATCSRQHRMVVTRQLCSCSWRRASTSMLREDTLEM